MANTPKHQKIQNSRQKTNDAQKNMYAYHSLGGERDDSEM
jgi:hypothetical protein